MSSSSDSASAAQRLRTTTPPPPAHQNLSVLLDRHAEAHPDRIHVEHRLRDELWSFLQDQVSALAKPQALKQDHAQHFTAGHRWVEALSSPIDGSTIIGNGGDGSVRDRRAFYDFIEDYMAFHSAAIAKMKSAQGRALLLNSDCTSNLGFKVLIMHVFGGFGNRALPAVSGLLLAMLSRRVFLLEWPAGTASLFASPLQWHSEQFPEFKARLYKNGACRLTFANNGKTDSTATIWQTDRLACANFTDVWAQDVINVHSNQFFQPLIFHNPVYRSKLYSFYHGVGKNLFAHLAALLFRFNEKDARIATNLNEWRRDFLRTVAAKLQIDTKQLENPAELEAALHEANSAVQRADTAKGETQRRITRALLAADYHRQSHMFYVPATPLSASPALFAYLLNDTSLPTSPHPVDARAWHLLGLSAIFRAPFSLPLSTVLISRLSQLPSPVLRVAMQFRSIMFTGPEKTLSKGLGAFFGCAELLGAELKAEHARIYRDSSQQGSRAAADYTPPLIMYYLAHDGLDAAVLGTAQERFGSSLWVVPHGNAQQLSNEDHHFHGLAEMQLLAESHALVTSGGSTYGYMATSVHNALNPKPAPFLYAARVQAHGKESEYYQSSEVFREAFVPGWETVWDGEKRQLDCVYAHVVSSEPCCHACLGWMSNAQDQIQTCWNDFDWRRQGYPFGYGHLQTC